MRKIRLQLENLEVVSFATTAEVWKKRGTVNGRALDTRYDVSACIVCLEPDTEALCIITAVIPCVEVSDTCVYETTPPC